jgi:hypothetical protein
MSGSLTELPMAVVLASVDPAAQGRGTIERWRRELRDEDELIVIDGPSGRLAPELWRDGLEATDRPVVALSTTAMCPTPGWRRAMLERLEATGAAVAGGPIRPLADDPVSRAIFLLRYVNYLPPLIHREGVEPPGDNAVYRRDRLEGLESLWKEGFWEAEIHRALRARGERTIMAEGGVVEHHGEGCLFGLLQKRYAHGRRYGASRAKDRGPAWRLLRIAAAPLVPFVLLGRIARALRSRGQSLVPWLPALPALLPLLAAWSLGEARGMGIGLLVGCVKHTGRLPWQRIGVFHTPYHRTRRCWHGRRRTRGWVSGGGGRFPGGATGGGGDGRARLPVGGGL